MIDNYIIVAAICLLDTIGFLFFAKKFYDLNGKFILSMKEVAELVVLLARYDKIENPAEQLARMLRMNPEDVRIEIERGRVMKLISIKAMQILTSMKCTVPGSEEILKPIEEKIGR